MTDNHCVEYEYPWSKNESGIRVTSHRKALSICDLDL